MALASWGALSWLKPAPSTLDVALVEDDLALVLDLDDLIVELITDQRVAVGEAAGKAAPLSVLVSLGLP
jgi:hypothetical protein